MRFIYLSPPTYFIFFSLIYFPVHRYCHFSSFLLTCHYSITCLSFPFFPYYFHVISSFLACHFLSAFLPLRYHLLVVFLLSFLPFPFCLPAISFLLACHFLSTCLPFFFLLTILTVYFHFKFHV